MKRFVTLILMLTTLLTFTQKVTAFAPELNGETTTMVNCSMSMGLNELHMDMSKIDCGGNEPSHSMECQSDCDLMLMVSVLYFIDHESTLTQTQSQLKYQTNPTDSPYYFSETLYRPPFLN